jgi:hypothetical protein
LFSQSWDLCTIAIGVVLIEAFKWKTIIYSKGDACCMTVWTVFALVGILV